MANIIIKPKQRKRHFVSYTLYALSASELKDLLAACEKMSDYILILLASRYGFRREDIVDIKINNVDLKNSTITYYEHKKRKDRTIPIEPDVTQELTRYINTIPAEKKTLGYLFPFRDGTTAWQHLQDICAVAKIPVPAGRTGRPFHALRGTCVKMRQAQGWNLNEVATLIGDEPGTVAKHYATVTTSELATKMRGGMT
jgi:integrase